MAIARLTSKGQITLPKEVRDYLHVDTGDEVDFVLIDGKVEIRPKTLAIEHLIGILTPTKSVSIEDMDKAMKKHAKRKYLKNDSH